MFGKTSNPGNNPTVGAMISPNYDAHEILLGGEKRNIMDITAEVSYVHTWLHNQIKRISNLSNKSKKIARKEGRLLEFGTQTWVPAHEEITDKGKFYKIDMELFPIQGSGESGISLLINGSKQSEEQKISRLQDALSNAESHHETEKSKLEDHISQLTTISNTITELEEDIAAIDVSIKKEVGDFKEKFYLDKGLDENAVLQELDKEELNIALGKIRLSGREKKLPISKKIKELNTEFNTKSEASAAIHALIYSAESKVAEKATDLQNELDFQNAQKTMFRLTGGKEKYEKETAEINIARQELEALNADTKVVNDYESKFQNTGINEIEKSTLIKIIKRNLSHQEELTLSPDTVSTENFETINNILSGKKSELEERIKIYDEREKSLAIPRSIIAKVDLIEANKDLAKKHDLANIARKNLREISEEKSTELESANTELEAILEARKIRFNEINQPITILQNEIKEIDSSLSIQRGLFATAESERSSLEIQIMQNGDSKELNEKLKQAEENKQTAEDTIKSLMARKAEIEGEGEIEGELTKAQEKIVEFEEEADPKSKRASDLKDIQAKIAEIKKNFNAERVQKIAEAEKEIELKEADRKKAEDLVKELESRLILDIDTPSKTVVADTSGAVESIVPDGEIDPLELVRSAL